MTRSSRSSDRLAAKLLDVLTENPRVGGSIDLDRLEPSVTFSSDSIS